VRASAASTGGSFTLIDSVARGGAPLHTHHREDEAMYVLDGRIRVDAGGKVHDVGEHGFVFLPREVPHAWDVIGDVARVLILTVPGGLDEFLREFHGATSGEDRSAVGRRHGIDI
jgi:quercetin dioxygenase-like cupin family protein